jgi:hypothetical protein
LSKCRIGRVAGIHDLGLLDSFCMSGSFESAICNLRKIEKAKAPCPRLQY